MPQARMRLALVALFLFSLTGSFAPRVVAQSGDATLTVHSRFCPPGFNGATDIFETCHDNPGIQGIEFQLQGPRWDAGLPDAEGNIIFASLPAGTYTLFNGLPTDNRRPYVFCSAGDGSEGQQIDTELTARQLLWNLLLIERRLGRVRAARWGPRTIDLDLLVFGELVVDEPDLQVPHPELALRSFVLVPLVEIDPQLVHPATGHTMLHHLSLLKTRPPVKRGSRLLN